MSRSVSASARASFFSPSMGDVVLLLLTIDEITLPDPIRIVHNNENITSRGDLFVAFQFGIELPAETGDAPQVVRIQLDAVDQTVIRAIREAAGQPSVMLEVVLSSDPDVVEAGPFNFRLETATYSALTVTGEISFEGVERVRSHNHSFTPFLFPDLF